MNKWLVMIKACISHAKKLKKKCLKKAENFQEWKPLTKKLQGI